MNLIVSAHLASSIITLFIAVSLLSSRALNPLCARYLGVNYLLFCIQHFLAVIVFSGICQQLGLVRATLALALGPALFVYYDGVMHGKSFDLRRFWPHLLPIPIMVIGLFLSNRFSPDLLILVSFFGYASFILFKFLSLDPVDLPHGPANSLARRWLGILLMVAWINFALELGIALEVFAGAHPMESWFLLIGSLLFFILHLLAFMLILTRAPLVEWMHELASLPTPFSDFSKQDLQTTFEQWETFVDREKCHISENGITVSRAAKRLGVPTRRLSSAINSIYGASFSQYLNDYRVSLAKALLLENKSTPVTDVYLSAGFATKSHFHREFSRVTGMTPSEYRQSGIKRR